MYLRKNPKVSLKLKARKLTEFGLVVSLALMVITFQAFKRAEINKVDGGKTYIPTVVPVVPETKQQNRQKAPARPTIPVESENEDIPEDFTIDSTTPNWDELPPPPPPPNLESQEPQIFLAYDEPPQPVGGFAAIQRNLKYPEMARKAGIQGRVIVQCVIDEKGNIVSAKIVKSLGNNGCDQAAIQAIQSVNWKPAKQRDQAVTVQIAIPVVFRLN